MGSLFGPRPPEPAGLPGITSMDPARQRPIIEQRPAKISASINRDAMGTSLQLLWLRLYRAEL
jgi:hypothetical protein